MLPASRLFRLLSMKRQNSSISATRLTETRTVSESDESFSAFLARRIAASSTKNDFLLSLACFGIITSLVMHTYLQECAYASSGEERCCLTARA